MQLDCCWTQTLLVSGIPKDAKGDGWWEMAGWPGLGGRGREGLQAANNPG